jgi:hypothetical protein
MQLLGMQLLLQACSPTLFEKLLTIVEADGCQHWA